MSSVTFCFSLFRGEGWGKEEGGGGSLSFRHHVKVPYYLQKSGYQCIKIDLFL